MGMEIPKMLSEITIFALAVLLVAAGMPCGWLLRGRFQDRLGNMRPGQGRPGDTFDTMLQRAEAGLLAAQQREQGSSCRHDGRANDTVDRDQANTGSGAAYNTAEVGDSAARPATFDDTITPARSERAYTATSHGTTGNELAVPCVRNTFSLALGHRLTESARRGDPLSVILVRIDNYQDLSDRHGVQFGNQILDAAGKFFIASVRGMDWVARFDATTFAFLLPNTSIANGWCVAERLRKTASATNLSVDGTSVPITLSLGITENQPGDSSQAILHRAEDAMNASIRTGGNCIHSHAGGSLETAPAAVKRC
jgi:diguanylate cyclase (GGDEF)-like protein